MCWCVSVCSEWPHALAKGWGSVRWCDCYVQVVSNLKTLGLQRHGVICTLPTRHGAADVF